MQPNQQQPTDWQQPAQSPPAAPFQAPAPVETVQPVPQITPVEPIAAVAQPQPIQPVQQLENVAPQQAVPEVVEAPMVPPIGTAAPATEAVADEEEPVELEYADAELPADDEALLRWEGTEYIHNSRSVKWYIIFGVVTVLAVVAAIVLLKSITFAILIPVMVVALLVYVRRAPDVLQYTVSRKGIHVNDKLFTYDQFKSFGIVSYNDAHSVVLTPRKRFQIGQTLYFPEEIGEQLVDMLAGRLPMKEVAPDAIDRLLAKLHL